MAPASDVREDIVMELHRQSRVGHLDMECAAVARAGVVLGTTIVDNVVRDLGPRGRIVG